MYPLNRQILSRLRQGPLTPYQALAEFGCFRLAARILELRQDGIEIKAIRIRVKNRNGKTAIISRYSLLRP